MPELENATRSETGSNTYGKNAVSNPATNVSSKATCHTASWLPWSCPSAAHQRHPRPFQRLRLFKRIPELDGHLFGPQVQRQLRWPRESVRAVVGLQYPSSFNAGTRLQYAVLSITDNHVVLVAQSKPNHACFLVHQQLGIAPSALFPHFVAATAQRGKLRVEFCFILPAVPPCAAQEHRWKER